MLQVISLVFQGVESLILDLPAGSSPPHDVPDVFRNQEKVGDPTEMLHLPIGVDLPVFQHIDQLVGVRLVERHAITEPKMMHNARRWILQGKDLHLAGLVEGPQVVEQKRVVARLDANDVMRASLTQVAKVGSVGAESVFDDDDRQVGMLLAKPFEPAAGSVPLAVVLGLTVLLDDRLGCQRDDFLEVGMDQGGPQQLMGGNEREVLTHPERLILTHLILQDSRSGQGRQFRFTPPFGSSWTSSTRESGSSRRSSRRSGNDASGGPKAPRSSARPGRSGSTR